MKIPKTTGLLLYFIHYFKKRLRVIFLATQKTYALHYKTLTKLVSAPITLKNTDKGPTGRNTLYRQTKQAMPLLSI